LDFFGFASTEGGANAEKANAPQRILQNTRYRVLIFRYTLLLPTHFLSNALLNP